MFLFLLESSIKILLHVMLSIGVSVISFGKTIATWHWRYPQWKREYICIHLEGQRISLRPIPPATRSTKKRVPSHVSRWNQSDRNLRASSFEKEGTDVGDQRTRQTVGQNNLTCLHSFFWTVDRLFSKVRVCQFSSWLSTTPFSCWQPYYVTEYLSLLKILFWIPNLNSDRFYTFFILNFLFFILNLVFIDRKSNFDCWKIDRWV